MKALRSLYPGLALALFSVSYVAIYVPAEIRGTMVSILLMTSLGVGELVHVVKSLIEGSPMRSLLWRSLNCTGALTVAAAQSVGSPLALDVLGSVVLVVGLAGTAVNSRSGRVE